MRKLLITSIFLFVCSFAHATCPYSYSVTSGGSYPTLESAVADAQTNCATLSSPLTITISGSWGSADITAVSITGITSSATNFITITTTGSARHAGKELASPSYYRNYITSDYSSNIYISVQYTTIDGLVLKNSGYAGIEIQLMENYCIVKNSLLLRSNKYGYTDDGVGISMGDSSSRIGTIYNNIIYETQIGIKNDQYYTNSAYIYNNTIYHTQYGIYGYGGSATGMIIKNNLVFGSTTCISASGSTTSNNGTSDTTGQIQNMVLADTFTAPTASPPDFSLKNGSGAIDVGASLGSPYNVDIIGTSRPQGSAYDLGAFEYISAGGNAATNDILLNDSVWNDTVFK